MPRMTKSELLQTLDWSAEHWAFLDAQGCICAPVEWGSDLYDVGRFATYYERTTGNTLPLLDHATGKGQAALQEARAELATLREEAQRRPESRAAVGAWQRQQKYVRELESAADA